MVKTLVAIEVDLASSFAIRYACQMGNLIQMEIHPIYVKFPSPEIPMTGVGWVRHSWEREVVETGKAEIQEVLASETESCPVLQQPRVIYGDREIELLGTTNRACHPIAYTFRQGKENLEEGGLGSLSRKTLQLYDTLLREATLLKDGVEQTASLLRVHC